MLRITTLMYKNDYLSSNTTGSLHNLPTHKEKKKKHGFFTHFCSSVNYLMEERNKGVSVLPSDYFLILKQILFSNLFEESIQMVFFIKKVETHVRTQDIS